MLCYGDRCSWSLFWKYKSFGHDIHITCVYETLSHGQTTINIKLALMAAVAFACCLAVETPL